MRTRKLNFLILLLWTLAIAPATTYSVAPAENEANSLLCFDTPALPLPPTATITVPDYPCNGELINVCVFGNAPGATYIWNIDPGNGSTINPTGVNMHCYAFTANGPQATVTVTVIDAMGAQATETVVITMEDCCSGNNNYWYNTSVSQVSGGGPLVVVGQTITISAPFIVDEDLTLIDCTVDLHPNVEIYVDPNTTFSINRTTMQACTDEMWGSIRLDDPTALFKSSGNSVIMEAQAAVVSHYGGNFEIEETTFDQNRLHLYAGFYAGNHAGTVKSSKFLCTAPLLPPYQGEVTEIAIGLAHLQHIQIGDPTSASDVNFIQKADYGIWGLNVGLDLYNNHFDQINVYDLTNTQPAGIAVRVTGASTQPTSIVNVGGAGTKANRIQHSLRGIRVQGNVKLNADNNTFRNIEERVISGESLLGNDLDITQNHLQDWGAGIVLENIGPSQINITDNTLIRSGALATSGPYYNDGIYAWTGSSTTGGSIVIRDNFIENVRKGIYVWNIPSAQVTFNQVRFELTHSALISFPTELVGIEVLESDFPRIKGNEVSRVGQDKEPFQQMAHKFTGIRVKDSRVPIVENNQANFFGDGYKFIGPFGGTATIRCNEAFTCWAGMDFQNADIGDQGSVGNPSGNIWSNILGPYRLTGNITGACDWYHINSANYIPVPYSVTGMSGVVTTGSSCSEQGGEGGNEPRKTDFADGSDLESQLEISLFPNPNNGRFKVKIEGMTNSGELSVWDTFGKKVYHARLKNGNELPISIDGLSKGMYLLEVETQNKTLTKKFAIH